METNPLAAPVAAPFALTPSTGPDGAGESPPADWRAILAARQPKRAPGWLVPHADKAAVWDAPAGIEPAIDVAAMSATAVISTPTPDRSDDVVEPLGIKLQNYARNPVVFFDHGLGGISLPIAKSEDPQGKLTVKPRADGIEATSYFAQGLCEACQIFDLIEQKIIRSTSIHLAPLIAKVRSDGNGLRPGLHIEEWELLEWSWVGIPDNPEAVRKILDRGRLAGSPICEPIRKCLLPWAAETRPLGKGFSLLPTTTPAPAAAATTVEGSRNSAARKLGSSVGEKTPTAKPGSERSKKQRKQGMGALKQAIRGLSSVVSILDQASKLVEEPKIAAFCGDLVQAIDAAFKEVSERHKPRGRRKGSQGRGKLPLSQFLPVPPKGAARQDFGELPSGLTSASSVEPSLRVEDSRAESRRPCFETTSRNVGSQATTQEIDWTETIEARLASIEKTMAAAAIQLLNAIPRPRS